MRCKLSEKKILLGMRLLGGNCGMAAWQAFVFGVMAALTPSLIVLCVLLLPGLPRVDEVADGPKDDASPYGG